MSEKLKWHTVSDTLAENLRRLMKIRELSDFRLVGGTSLSLQLGHRKSFDIDMFTNAVYGSVNFSKIDSLLRTHFKYVSEDHTGDMSNGLMCMVGNSYADAVKLDLFYSDHFINEIVEIDGIRMASIEDITAMKLEVISSDGRKRDFWDIHELIEVYSINRLLDIYKERNPYLEVEKVIAGLTNFERADQEDNPVCLKGKYWELVKYDFEEIVKEYKASL